MAEVVEDGFWTQTGELTDEARWLNTDGQHWTLKEAGATCRLQVGDFWQRTFYSPPICKSNAPALLRPFPPDHRVETEFVIEPQNQFDQAGLLVYCHDQCWLKAGIEYADGALRLSTVVTNGFSDWSTQVVATAGCALRVSRTSVQDYVVEVQNEAGAWDFIRIAHLDTKEQDTVRAGLYACAPQQIGGLVRFSRARLQQGIDFAHSA
ncbi:uncharacterized protein MONBRDRAFT_22205 [Monosiga brevicollis MX1]|uniref:DUF1349 domain-containing protein n=1 Tax=Monosiga brevicollis TaxID=81824 RepID=A9UPV7_MONBE|nr:uncharacterized protein MONBRDRAFT_22205 [Monosiga brevicollis MX1]EDQ92941.1 predicted protein [Monosiga brevicollis MX1]|eukprot:XP_001742703.1 hypothetical protein [Monosiga brevicollis MX1]